MSKDNMSKTMDNIADASPFIAFVVACLAFIIIILFKSDYYAEVFSQRWNYWAAIGVGFTAALAAEASRAILLLLTFRDFRNGNLWGGFLGLILSFALVGYDAFSAGPISSIWTGEHTAQIKYIITDVVVFLVALSAGLELRLALSTKQGKKKRNETATETQQSEMNETAKQRFFETAAKNSNGNGNPPNFFNETQQSETGQRIVVKPFVASSQKNSNAVSNGVTGSGEDFALLSEKLERAKGNLRAYKSKMRNGNGNPETLQRGINKWTQRVAAIEAQLQDAT